MSESYLKIADATLAATAADWILALEHEQDWKFYVTPYGASFLLAHPSAAVVRKPLVTEGVLHSGTQYAHSGVRVTLPAHRSPFKWCALCGDWYEPVPLEQKHAARVFPPGDVSPIR